MAEILQLPIAELAPTREAVLANQGVPPGVKMSQDIETMCSQAIERLLSVAEPLGVLAEISRAEFADLFEGEGENETSTPVGDIFPQSDHMALFAITLGKGVSRDIDALFQADDFALGCMLDAAASAAADAAAAEAEQRYAIALAEAGNLAETDAALRYSPGYCGWHISGQKKLFAYLEPELIGLTLRPSYLMEPLKSVSGVILAGPREIHEFTPSYPSCDRCETYSCRDRISSLFV